MRSPAPQLTAPPQIVSTQINSPDDENVPHNTPPTPSEPPLGKNKNRSRTALKVASLNMRGRGSSGDTILSNKWFNINQIMKDKKIGILAIQEAHLTEDYVDTLHTLFGKRLHILFSQGPNPNAQGVAFVINKETIAWREVSIREITPGRALLLTVPWRTTKLLTILNVYAPNVPSDNGNFWSLLENKWTDRDTHLPIPDVMLGDFNVVEDALDRLPSHLDSTTATSPLHCFRSTLNLLDGWRSTFPTTKAFSFMQGSTKVQSRIDRIYTSRELLQTASDWEIDRTAITTDHKMVSVNLIDQDAPFTGRGRWTLPLFLIKDPILKKDIHKLGLNLQEKLRSNQPRTLEHNPQALFKTFKDDLTKLARDRAKIATPKLEKEIRKLKADLKLTLANPMQTEEDLLSSAGILEARIEELEHRRHLKSRLTTAARDRLEGETISKYWSQVNKTKKPRDIIYSLRKPHSTPAEYEKRSDKMAELARQYHHDLLSDGLTHPPTLRENIIQEVLGSISETDRLNNDQGRPLEDTLTHQDVIDALKSMPSGTATGLDGLPYELFIALYDRYIVDSKNENDAFDIIDVLTRLYNDIESHGVLEDSDFAVGWMCPLYKKKDKREIANYRPITLLNSDYKIFTKALSTKLTRIAALIIHPNQAGFMPNRSIADHIQLAKMMITYAEEAIEENGVIIALDQEKAYDKITHDYLWKTLKAYNLPEKFIATLKSLYTSAETKVMINGNLSSPFKVTRGVRQGDPLSCLIFNIAIEPLANMLRKSNIKGFEIPGVTEKVITTLFADDTTVYLSQFDSFSTLNQILDKWCIASGARFNVDKTEALPIGSPEFRENFIATRKLNPNEPPLPSSIHIAQDQEPVRILGGWVGNNVNQATVWSKILDKAKDSLERWGRSNPTIFGKRHIVNMVIGGYTQYLTKVQGMPKQTVEALEKMEREFIWDAKRPPISIDTLYKPISEGGIKLLNIKARNEAIDIMWLQSYLHLGPTRPTWAFIADALIGKKCSRTSGEVNNLAQMNLYLQTWKPALRTNSSLPDNLYRMLRVGKQYHISFDALKLPESLKALLPAWYHFGIDKHLQKINNVGASKCLRKTHKVRTVGDLVNITRRERDTVQNHPHTNRLNCACTYCKHDRHVLGCESPNKCHIMAKRILHQLTGKWNPNETAPADGLTHTPNRIQLNETARLTDQQISFNPSVTAPGSLAQNFRIFTNPNARCSIPAYRKRTLVQIAEEEITVYTDGSCINNGNENAACGSGIWFGTDDPRNTSLRIPGKIQSNQVGELAAILHTLRITPPFAQINFISDSKYVIDALTLHHKKWEQRGWIGIANKDIFKPTLALLRQRGAVTTFQWVKGHNGNLGNEGADALAGIGAEKANPDHLNLEIDPRFDLSGAQLSTTTQSLAYKGIMSSKRTDTRRAALINLDITRYATESAWGKLPTDTNIWKSLRHPDFNRTVRAFLWKAIHNAHRIGDFWQHIPNYEQRGTCHACEMPETMTHVLTECDIPGREHVWRLAKSLWLKKNDTWPEIKNLGSITRCGLADFRKNDNTPDTGANRLYRILISEAAHLIWRLRCTRVIELGSDEETWPTLTVIERRWRHLIKQRFAMDCRMTNKKFGDKALKPQQVTNTWKGILHNEDDLPDDWLRTPTGVLVGIGFPEQVLDSDDPPDPP